jgi:transcriptional regulator with XRE-family HTH domain
MKLAAWMEWTCTGDEELAAKVGVGRSMISRVRRGKRLPSYQLMQAIAEATGGAVRPDDFFDLPPARRDAKVEAA